jgi:hypothetical protein
MQLAGHAAHQLAQPALDGAVDVLVGRVRGEAPLGELAAHGLEPARDLG